MKSKVLTGDQCSAKIILTPGETRWTYVDKEIVSATNVHDLAPTQEKPGDYCSYAGTTRCVENVQKAVPVAEFHAH